MAMAGESPSMQSTSGLSIIDRNCRAYAESDSTYRRCPSAYRVSNASEDLPEPDRPVITISRSRGRSRFDVLQVVRARAADADLLHGAARIAGEKPASVTGDAVFDSRCGRRSPRACTVTA